MTAPRDSWGGALLFAAFLTAVFIVCLRLLAVAGRIR